MSIFEKGLITICVLYAVFCVVSLPLIFRKVPRNPVYGYRTRATLSDDELWYEANAYFGRWLVILSFLAVFAAVALYFWRGVSPETYMNLSIVLMIAPVTVAAILTRFFVRSWSGGGRFSDRNG